MNRHTTSSRIGALLAPWVLVLTIHCGGSPDDDSASAAGAGSPTGQGVGNQGAGAGSTGGFDPAGGSGGTSEPGPLGGAAGEGGSGQSTGNVSLQDVALYINLGDSLAAGYDAAGNNGPGGKGYARLLQSNHPDYASYAGANLTAVAGNVDFRDVSDSGATSDEILANLHSKIDDFPTTVDGDVLLTISAGGNDFNDSIAVMLSAALTQGVATKVRQNLAAMVSLVRDRYEDSSQGKEVIVVFQTLHDPTGGTGSIPPGFDDGFCSTLQNPMLQPFVSMVLDNLQTMNDAIVEEAASQGAYLSDNQAVFLDHGMNAPGAERWLSDDCVHPTSEGHNQIRREMWGVLTGDWH